MRLQNQSVRTGGNHLFSRFLAALTLFFLRASSLMTALTRRWEKMSEKAVAITLQDRLVAGSFTLKEVAALKAVGMTMLYADIGAGRLPIVKMGRATRVLGPHVRAYRPGVGLVPEQSNQ
jgi:hypothetical protein